MNRFLRFFALTTATQVCVLVQQVLLLPLQVRLWGNEVAADWFVVVAVANLASVFDLGLRNAGHHPLLASQHGDAAAAREFRQVWALTRLLLLGLTVGFLAWQTLAASPFLLAATMTLAAALETTLIVRGIWFDSLGAFNKVEAIYFGMSAARIVLSIAALVLLRAPPQTLAWIALGTSGLALWTQARVLRTPALSLWAGGFRDLRWRSLAVVRFVVAEPAVGWMRISLPVLVFAAFTPPAFITTFVALRAVFGLARQVVAQLARYASVQYVQRAKAARRAAELLAIRAILGTTLIGVAVSAVALTDHGRLLRLWLGGTTLDTDRLTVVSFAIGAIAFGYQVVAGVCIRSGDVVGVAKRHYAYLLAGGMAALLAPFVPNPASVYLVLLAMLELFIAAMFMPALGPRVLRASLAAAGIAAFTLCGLLGVLDGLVSPWLARTYDGMTPHAVAVSATAVLGAVLVALLALVAIDRWSQRTPPCTP